MATIRISLGAKGQILIEPAGEIDAEEWYALQNWWSSEPSTIEQQGPISVLASEFAYKKNWLRENWTRLGHKVELDKEVLVVTQAAEGLIADFERLATKPDRASDVDTTTLLLNCIQI
jgi:hypothetical protein